MLAAQNGHTDVVRTLLSWGADIDEVADVSHLPLLLLSFFFSLFSLFSFLNFPSFLHSSSFHFLFVGTSALFT